MTVQLVVEVLLELSGEGFHQACNIVIHTFLRCGEAGLCGVRSLLEEFGEFRKICNVDLHGAFVIMYVNLCGHRRGSAPYLRLRRPGLH